MTEKVQWRMASDANLIIEYRRKQLVDEWDIESTQSEIVEEGIRAFINCVGDSSNTDKVDWQRVSQRELFGQEELEEFPITDNRVFIKFSDETYTYLCEVRDHLNKIVGTYTKLPWVLRMLLKATYMQNVLHEDIFL